ncbi:response regulator [Aquibacillus kalidii]|uniref:response regulator n=1 Tax=Aquibacillus kalidii TaxID=2762597 RepID=UPI0016445CFC|nr:response regulator [Aquibacillus kalidii]
MIKLLIVDDEQIEREGIHAILRKHFPEVSIEEAKNGKIAMEKVEEIKPDLVLMDIKMPGISGLEAMERINEGNSSIKFIIMTAYAEFSFAQQAIKLGALDYIVKPSRASDIVKTIGVVLEQIEEEKKIEEMNSIQEITFQKALPIIETDIVTQLLFDHVHDVHLNELVDLLDIRMTNEMFVICVLLPPYSETRYRVIKERIRQLEQAWIGAIYGRQLPIIVFRDPKKSFRSQAVTLAREILSIVQSRETDGWFIGIGNVYNKLDETRQSYQESFIATKDTTRPAKFCFYTDLPKLTDGNDLKKEKQLEQKFFEHIRSGRWEAVSEQIIGLIHQYENNDTDLLEAQQRVLEIVWLASRLLNEIGIELVTPRYATPIFDYRQLRVEVNHLINQMKQHYMDHVNQIEEDTTYQIKQYIMEHSNEDISLESIATKFELSPIYISKIFKEKFGVNYIHFLTECRIEKAKKLISNPEKSLKEITFDVGYHDPNYFSKVFKKFSGMSPNEYRKKLLTIIE